MVNPAFENKRSEEAEVAGIAKYLAAKLYNSENCDLFLSHHSATGQPSHSWRAFIAFLSKAKFFSPVNCLLIFESTDPKILQLSNTVPTRFRISRIRNSILGIPIYVKGVPYLLIRQHAANFSELDE